MAQNIAITSAEWESKVIGSDQPVLVDFWATWCGPCLAIGPAIEQLATEYEGKARVFKLDVDQDGEIASQYGIMGIPALLVFKGGKVVEQYSGPLPKERIASMIDRAL